MLVLKLAIRKTRRQAELYIRFQQLELVASCRVSSFIRWNSSQIFYPFLIVLVYGQRENHFPLHLPCAGAQEGHQDGPSRTTLLMSALPKTTNLTWFWHQPKELLTGIVLSPIYILSFLTKCLACGFLQVECFLSLPYFLNFFSPLYFFWL